MLSCRLRIRIITCRVHQRSILGPILILLYIIDFENFVRATTLETVYKGLVQPVGHLRQVIDR